jgi:hypothetical protein
MVVAGVREEKNESEIVVLPLLIVRERMEGYENGWSTTLVLILHPSQNINKNESKKVDVFD